MKLIPNALSLLRGLIITPLVLWFSLTQSWKITFALFVLGGITDALDGYLAVKLDAQTKIGGLIDMLSDGAMMGALILGLVATGVIPLWTLVIAGAIGLAFFLTERLCTGRISRLSAGLAPFWGFSLGVAIATLVAFQALRGGIVYLIPPAIVAGLVILIVKRGRILELFSKLK